MSDRISFQIWQQVPRVTFAVEFGAGTPGRGDAIDDQKRVIPHKTTTQSITHPEPPARELDVIDVSP
ncbi:hypothetical protein [Rothia uropygialis]|uniref:hypothetical protein n=1 Tax=Kocuria sp. 36 TaxID=1415402 RepID=UPI00101C0990|nr:hypothetical protein [Kocuria sp. 36]